MMRQTAEGLCKENSVRGREDGLLSVTQWTAPASSTGLYCLRPVRPVRGNEGIFALFLKRDIVKVARRTCGGILRSCELQLWFRNGNKFKLNKSIHCSVEHLRQTTLQKIKHFVKTEYSLGIIEQSQQGNWQTWTSISHCVVLYNKGSTDA